LKARAYLRDVTREAHERVDSKLSGFRLSDADDYAEFLAVQAAAFIPVEAALDRAGAARLLPDWDERRRSDALLADLAALGRPAPVTNGSPVYDDEAAVWGGLYVIEGSRLGGLVLRKSVPADFPQAFLSPQESRNSSWPAFVAAMERSLYEDPALQRAGSSAIDTFACFEKSFVKGVTAR
jgi:heme oxygenase